MVFALFLLGDGTPVVQKPEELYALERYFSLADGVIELERRYRWAIPRVEDGRVEVVAAEIGIDMNKMLAEDAEKLIVLAALVEDFAEVGRDALTGPYPLRIDVQRLPEIDATTRHRMTHEVIDGWMVVTLAVVAEPAGVGSMQASPLT